MYCTGQQTPNSPNMHSVYIQDRLNTMVHIIRVGENWKEWEITSNAADCDDLLQL